jgi:AraC-like DNA-binding protein
MTRAERQQRLATVLDLIERAHGLVTESEASKHLDVSEIWFRHEFTRHFGQPFRAARLAAKLGHGRILLSTTDLDIPTISTVLEYSDRTKFEKAFKRLFGLTPSQYRQRQAQPLGMM